MSGFEKLCGENVGIDFDLDFNDWPIAGYPAWGKVISVDMPLVEIGHRDSNQGIWINAKYIKKIWKS